MNGTFSQHLQVFSNWETIWLVKFLLQSVPSERYEMSSLHSDRISFSRLSMSFSSICSYSLKAFPLSMVMYLFMAWPNFSARDVIPTDFADDSSNLQISASINFSPLVSSYFPELRFDGIISYQLAGIFAKQFRILVGVSKTFHLISVTTDRFSHCEVKSTKT